MNRSFKSIFVKTMSRKEVGYLFTDYVHPKDSRSWNCALFYADFILGGTGCLLKDNFLTHHKFRFSIDLFIILTFVYFLFLFTWNVHNTILLYYITDNQYKGEEPFIQKNRKCICYLPFVYYITLVLEDWTIVVHVHV